MKITEALSEIRTTIATLNDKLDTEGLNNVTISNSRIDLGSKDNTLVCYPTASNGTTYKESDGSGIIMVSIEFYMSDEFSPSAMENLEKYYSAIVEFLHDTTFCQASEITDSVIFRMDEGESANGCAFLLTVRIASDMDYGWV